MGEGSAVLHVGLSSASVDTRCGLVVVHLSTNMEFYVQSNSLVHANAITVTAFVMGTSRTRTGENSVGNSEHTMVWASAVYNLCGPTRGKHRVIPTAPKGGRYSMLCHVLHDFPRNTSHHSETSTHVADQQERQSYCNHLLCGCSRACMKGGRLHDSMDFKCNR